MFKFCSLYSGSSGNASLIQSESTKILIDCGVSNKKIEEALDLLKIDASSIDAILLTHEHSDHIKGLPTFYSKHKIPVYANKETFENMKKSIAKIDDKDLKKFKVNSKFIIGDIDISPFSIPHDAANPCGFNISHNNKKISVATDIGHMTNEIIHNLEGSSFILLESNYDPEILKYCSYPYPLKTRISGPSGHLSNEIAGKTISYLYKSGLKSAMLGHLSKESNFPELAYKTTMNELISEGIDTSKFSLNVALRDNPSKIIDL